MSESIKALEALRDAARGQQDFQRDKTGDTATQLYYGAAQLVSCCGTALAALRAEEPQADGWSVARCSRCGQTWTFNVTPPMCNNAGTSVRCVPIPRAHQQPASEPAPRQAPPCDNLRLTTRRDPKCYGDVLCECGQPRSMHDAQQPAPADVPPMPLADWAHNKGYVCYIDDVRALHAAAVRLAEQLAEAQAALKQARAEERERVAAALEKLDKEQAAGFVRGLPREQA